MPGRPEHGQRLYSVAATVPCVYRGRVLTPPDGLTELRLHEVLRRRWRMDLTALDYLPVGWGSHHWKAVTTMWRISLGMAGVAPPRAPGDRHDTRWFVTVDDLEGKQLSDCEPLAAVFARLRGSLSAAVDLRESGAPFVLAPVPARDGAPVAQLTDRFAVAVYPFVDGQTFGSEEFSAPGHRRSLLDMVIAVHTAPGAARRHALADDFAVPCRYELEAACDPAVDVADSGPYALAASALVRRSAAAISRLLARYDQLVAAARSQPPGRAVLTHGEPHPGNTILTSGECASPWLLIDWDTALIAPPERDLWSLDPGDGTILRAYAEATGVVPEPALLELYRLRWDMAELALDSRRLRRPHADTADTSKTWRVLRSLVERIESETAV
jgi:hypothetical protein